MLLSQSGCKSSHFIHTIQIISPFISAVKHTKYLKRLIKNSFLHEKNLSFAQNCFKNHSKTAPVYRKQVLIRYENYRQLPSNGQFNTITLPYFFWILEEKMKIGMLKVQKLLIPTSKFLRNEPLVRRNKNENLQ